MDGHFGTELFAICSTTSRQKCYSTVQLVLGRGMNILIKQRVDWESIRQRKKTQNNKDNTHENKQRVDYDYKVGDKVILLNHTV